MSDEFEISFAESIWPPVKVPAGDNLSEHLHACNSTLLFGCRSGLCGTCLVEVVEGKTMPPTEAEREALEIYAPDNPKARLACQIEVLGEIKLKKCRW